VPQGKYTDSLSARSEVFGFMGFSVDHGVGYTWLSAFGSKFTVTVKHDSWTAVCQVLSALGAKHVTGTDYSPGSIKLATAVKKHFRRDAQGVDQEGDGGLFLDDILRTKMSRGTFDLLHDR
jgi:hypothetical protein